MSKHKRNIQGICAHAQKRRQDALKRADEAIRLLLREGRSINFNTVSRTAKVSTAWLYKQESIKKRIQHLRKENSPRVAIPRRERASDTSKDAIIATLRERVKHQEEEIKELKHKVEVAFGQLVAQER